MKDGMGAEYEQAMENANSKLDQYADALTAAGSRRKAAFNDNPGLTGFIDEVTNAVPVSYTHLTPNTSQTPRRTPAKSLFVSNPLIPA